MSEKSARYYYYSHIRFAANMADGRIPKKFRRHPKLSDFVAANCCRNSGTPSQIFCSCFKWLDIAEFLKPPLNDLMPQKFGGFLNVVGCRRFSEAVLNDLMPQKFCGFLNGWMLQNF